MKKMSDVAEEQTRSGNLDDFKSDLQWPDEIIPKYMQDNIIVKHLDGPLFFGFASGFQEKINKLPKIRFVIIRMEKVPFIDQTGLYALEEAVLGLEQRGVHVLLTGLQKQPADMLRGIELIPALIPEENLFHDFQESITWLAKNKKDELM